MLHLRKKNFIIKFNNWICDLRFLSTQESPQIKYEPSTRTDPEWLNAKPFNQLPGPSKYLFPLQFLPGGKLHNGTLIDIHKIMYGTYGDISILRGNFGQYDTVFSFNAEDFEKVYRTEGLWPIRIGLNTFDHYRKNVKPEIFKGIGGLVTEQGKSWSDIRGKVNPVLMKTQTIRHHLPQIDEIATELLNKLPKIRDPVTNEMPANFGDEIKKWSFESISSIALNRRLGLITSDNPDEKVLRLADAMSIFFQLSYEFDVVPSFWKYYETKSFKKLMKTYDDITEITINFIEESIKEFEKNKQQEAKSALEQLLKIDKQVAIVMAMDMLMAGIDTTTSAFITILYHLAKNPNKQERLRQELIKILPERNTPLTAENTKNMPYLRACIKESLRITPITPGNFRMTGQDLVLSGYQIPKGTGVLMGVMTLSNDETFFLKSDDFMPERWLKDIKDGCPEAKANNPFVYLPFGFGPRTCIGKRIAEMEIETLISKIIRNYKVSWNQSDLQYTSNIILIPKGDMKFIMEDL